jgi:hypothetical protein
LYKLRAALGAFPVAMPKNWDLVRERIELLYVRENRTAEEVKRMIEDEFGFRARYVRLLDVSTSIRFVHPAKGLADRPSIRTWRKQLLKWGLAKYSTASRPKQVGVAAPKSTSPLHLPKDPLPMDSASGGHAYSPLQHQDGAWETLEDEVGSVNGPSPATLVTASTNSA